MPRLVARGLVRVSKVTEALVSLGDVGAMVELFYGLFRNIILSRVSVLFFVLAILEHDLSVADLEDFGGMVDLFVDQPRLVETMFDFFPTGSGRPSLLPLIFNRYFLFASGTPGARVTSMASRISWSR
jgi:hypothetical protein